MIPVASLFKCSLLFVRIARSVYQLYGGVSSGDYLIAAICAVKIARLMLKLWECLDGRKTLQGRTAREANQITNKVGHQINRSTTNEENLTNK